MPAASLHCQHNHLHHAGKLPVANKPRCHAPLLHIRTLALYQELVLVWLVAAVLVLLLVVAVVAQLLLVAEVLQGLLLLAALAGCCSRALLLGDLPWLHHSTAS
jgi:hypothetical protein